MRNMRILIIDDEESMRHMLSVILKREGCEPVAFADASQALAALSSGDFDFILCDIKMPGMDGFEFLKGMKEKGRGETVIMMSAYASLDTAIECMKLGAYDYISKPFKSDEIILTLKKAEERERLKQENRRLRAEAGAEYGVQNIITKDAGMQETLALIKKVSGYSTTALITGESGTGKELAARAIHYGGPRALQPFVAVNCGAIPKDLLESELFGHVRGAFTGADRNKTGLFQEADQGTIFLDEVGELPLELQVNLLRVLQEKEIRRVGGTKPIKIDARVVAATVRDLRHEIKEGRFREDLFYRLNVIEIKMPPLRERPVDIEPLSLHFIEKYAGKFGKPVKRLSKDARDALQSHAWPGNVRELENAIERAMILEESDTIGKDVLPIGERPRAGAPFFPLEEISIKKAEETLEKELIKKALERTNNNRTRAAELLEISHRALLYKIKSYGL